MKQINVNTASKQQQHKVQMKNYGPTVCQFYCNPQADTIPTPVPSRAQQLNPSSKIIHTFVMPAEAFFVLKHDILATFVESVNNTKRLHTYALVKNRVFWCVIPRGLLVNAPRFQ